MGPTCSHDAESDPMVMQRREVENAQVYTVTAIVPCRNERESIERCVLSILDQEKCEGGIEIIVVDGLSDDGTPAILNRLALEYPSLKVFTNPKRTKPAGVNIGIQAARGRYIAILWGLTIATHRTICARVCRFLRRRTQIMSAGA